MCAMIKNLLFDPDYYIVVFIFATITSILQANCMLFKCRKLCLPTKFLKHEADQPSNCCTMC